VFLAEPASTPYDLNFRLLGIRVRVVPWFWLVALLLGWDLTQAREQQAMLLTLWIAAVFLSILVHEMGHALAMRFYGIDSYIVLYQFGGLAISDSYSPRMGYGSRRMRDDPISQIVISAAGPAAQFGLALAVVAGLWIIGYQLAYEPDEGDFFIRLPLPYVDSLMPPATARLLPSAEAAHAIRNLLWVSVFWPLLNLLPVYPLDGGQIARNVFGLFHPAAGIQYSLILSVVTGAAVALYGFSQQQLFLAIMFALLAFSSFQVLQAYSGRGGFGP
jgi:stage IV sporulation protein FB